MLMPSIFGENLFDDFMDFPFDKEFFGRRNPLYGKNEKNLMKTDVKETDSSFEVDVDLPGFKKDEITVKLEDGYLTIGAAKGLEKEETDEKQGKYIRRERYSGQCTRSFHVDKAIKEEDVSARFEDGILRLTILKKDEKKAEEKKYIAIEG